MAKKRAGTEVATRGGQANPAPVVSRQPPASVPALPLGFTSLAHFAAFALFATLLLVAPFFFSGFWPSSYEYWPQAMFLAVVACICLLLAISGAAPPSPKSQAVLSWLLGAFFVWCVLSLLGTVYLHDSLLELSRVLGVVACFFVACNFLATPKHTAPRVLWLLTAVAVGIVAVCLPAIWDFLVTRNPRQFATFYNPNLFANYCAMALPLSAAGVLLWRQRARDNSSMIVAVGLGVLAIIVLGLIVTSSKGGLLSAFCGGLVFVAALLRAKGERVRRVLAAHKVAFAIISLLLILGVGVLFSQTVLPRLTTNLESDHSTMFRVYTWAGTWRMAEARPLIGWGAGSFPSAYPQFAETGYTRSAHQSWLQIAAENGFPAMILLLAACGYAIVRGWKMLKTTCWSMAAGGIAAVTAFAVHGLTDSGWNIISIAVLLMAALAVASAECEVRSADSAIATRGPSLNWPWLLATVALALGSWLTQRAQAGEDLRTESRELMARGARNSALQSAREATEANPLSARLWTNFAQIQEANGENPIAAYGEAIEQQPTRALNYLSRAEARIAQGLKEDVAADLDKAVQLDSNDPQIRATRGYWLLEQNEERGWDDLEHIASLADAPYGRYPATPEMVDLNFARTYVKLAERDIARGNAESAQKYIARGLEDIAMAQQYEEQRRAMEIEMRGVADERRTREIAELEAQFESLQEKIS